MSVVTNKLIPLQFRVFLSPVISTGGGTPIIVKDTYLPPTPKLTRVYELAKQPAKDRKREEEVELLSLHVKWIEAGGRLLFDPEVVKLPQIFDRMRSGLALVEEGSQPILESPLWGRADLKRLNAFAKHYHGNLGQAELARDLAVAMGALPVNVTKFFRGAVWPERHRGERRSILKTRSWSHIPIDWRRYLYFNQLGQAGGLWDVYSGVDGYDTFSSTFFHGDSLKAWFVASSLLSKDNFKRLKWGKQKRTNVNEQEAIRQELIEGLKNGSLIGEKGYDHFATDRFQGDSLRAWKVASSLLSKDGFKRLKWGKQKFTNVSEQKAIRQELVTGLKDRSLVGEAGYDRFATNRFQGDSQKAWVVASSLLSKDDFKKLRWGKGKYTKVNEQEAIREELIEGLKDGSLVGEAGYDRFATNRFQGDSQKAWMVASSLLSKDDFKKLKWGKQKRTNVNEQEVIRQELMAGLKDGSLVGEAGYDHFATDRFQGDSLRAWKVASSLLSKDGFKRLKWGKAKYTNVNEQEAIRQELVAGLKDGSLVGEKGYDRFATNRFQGDSLKAWVVASSLLSKADFKKLKWEKAKKTNVNEQEAIREELIEGLKNGSLVGAVGYDRFATNRFQGDSLKAWMVASSLLSKDDFNRLKWGKQKQTNVNEQEAIRQELIKGLQDGSLVGEKGYDRFAVNKYHGDSQKAWQVASSLLSKDDFKKLNWRKGKLTNVNEQEAIRQELMNGLEDGSLVGERGYDRFATNRFQGDSKKTWQVASSLLSKDDFKRLKWGKQKKTKVDI